VTALSGAEQIDQTKRISKPRRRSRPGSGLEAIRTPVRAPGRAELDVTAMEAVPVWDHGGRSFLQSADTCRGSRRPIVRAPGRAPRPAHGRTGIGGGRLRTVTSRAGRIIDRGAALALRQCAVRRTCGCGGHAGGRRPRGAPASLVPRGTDFAAVTCRVQARGALVGLGW
jgi:hypothetical protein